MAGLRKYDPEVMRRAVDLVRSSGRPIRHIAGELGIGSESLRKAVRVAEERRGVRPDQPFGDQTAEIRRLRNEVEELRRTNEVLRLASVYVAQQLGAVSRSGQSG